MKYIQALDVKGFTVLPVTLGTTLLWHEFGVAPNLPLEVLMFTAGFHRIPCSCSEKTSCYVRIILHSAIYSEGIYHQRLGLNDGSCDSRSILFGINIKEYKTMSSQTCYQDFHSQRQRRVVQIQYQLQSWTLIPKPLQSHAANLTGQTADSSTWSEMTILKANQISIKVIRIQTQTLSTVWTLAKPRNNGANLKQSYAIWTKPQHWRATSSQPKHHLWTFPFNEKDWHPKISVSQPGESSRRNKRRIPNSISCEIGLNLSNVPRQTNWLDSAAE